MTSNSYSNYKENINTGDILAWTHKGWNSWYNIKVQIVRAFTQSEYSHVGIAWVIGGRIFVIEAVVPRIRIYPLGKELPFYHIPITKDYWSTEIEELALEKVGEGYSQLEAIHAFFKHNVDALIADGRWQCSEFVSYILEQGGVFRAGKVGKVTPSRVVEHLQELGYRVGLVTKDLHDSDT